MIEVFQDFTVANVQAAKADCLLVEDKHVYIGTSDGNVIQYEMEFRTGGNSNIVNVKGKLVKSKLVGTARKGVEAIALARGLNSVLVLCDGAIYALDSRTLEVLYVVHQAKGCTSFTVKEGGGNNECWLLVAKGKKLTVLHQKKGEKVFDVKFEQSIAEAVVSMCWTGEQACLVTKKDSGLFDYRTGSYTPVLEVEGKNRIISKAIEGEYFIMRSDIGVVVDASAMPRPYSAFCWTEGDLLGYATSKPYIVGVHPGGLAVYSIPRGHTQMALVQKIAMPGRGDGVCIAAASLETSAADYVFVTNRSGGGLSCLVPATLRSQVAHLVSQKRVEEAEVLLKNCVADSELEVGLQRLHRDAGLQAFAEMDFNGAAQHLRESSPHVLHPGELVRLFPEVMEASGALPQTFYAMGHSEELEFNPFADVGDIRELVMKASLEDGGLLLNDDEKQKVVKSQAVNASTCVLRLLADFHRKVKEVLEPLSDTSRSSRADGESVRYWTALLEDIDTWTAMLLAYSDSKDVEEFVQLPPPGAVTEKPNTGPLNLNRKARKRATQSRDFRFVAPNYCRLAEVEAYLKSKEKYNALAFMLRARGMHSSALDIWRQLGGGELIEVGKDGVSPSVETLKQFVPDTPEGHELTLRHSGWLMRVSPFDSVEIFTEACQSLDPDRVLQHIASTAGDITRLGVEEQGLGSASMTETYRDACETPMDLYLAHLVESRERTEERFHTAYGVRLIAHVSSCLDAAMQNGEAMGDAVPFEKPGKGASAAIVDLYDSRERLVRFLEKSSTYDVRVLLRRLKPLPVREECVLLYKTAGRHDKALQIMLRDMNNFTAAERYCLGLPWSSHSFDDEAEIDDIFDANAQKVMDYSGRMGSEDERSDLFLLLLASLLSPELGGGKESDKETAMRLLETHCDKIEPQGAIRVVSANIPLQDVVPFLEPALRRSSKRHHLSQVTKHLSQYELMHMRSKLISMKSHAVVVKEATTCPVCGKKIGDKVFATFPNGEIVHFKCYDHSKPTRSPVTNVDYSEVFEKNRE
uniref:CNH domain-containing protein n=1 Tax=Palpitomonas bilix TaxID=652834 RepID=A0A7S3DM72_9EUKA|mmetsp:Transcript_43327/g.112664  ORF Transcript_43327/g.112664 Transcript_43327/m.112664 type:complete len:1034 (+) Transcript_43327:67-3168(+)